MNETQSSNRKGLNLSKAQEYFLGAKKGYNEKNFILALELIEKAKSERRDVFLKAIDDLIFISKTSQAKEANDSIYFLLRNFYKKLNIKVVNITLVKNNSIKAFWKELENPSLNIEDIYINKLLGVLNLVDSINPDYYNFTSIEALKEKIKQLQYYPEAELLKAKIFFADSELGLAVLELEKANSHLESLEVLDDKWDIRYWLLDIYKKQSDKTKYEELLKIIVDDNKFFRERSLTFQASMIRSIENWGFDRFFSLFKIDENKASRAWLEFAIFNFVEGKENAELYALLAVSSILTHILNRIRETKPNYDFVNTKSLFVEIDKNSELKKYAMEYNLWSSFYVLAAILKDRAYLRTANEILNLLSQQRSIEPWNYRARDTLASAKTNVAKSYFFFD